MFCRLRNLKQEAERMLEETRERTKHGVDEAL